MSIATRTGDNGTTALLFNRRVSKTHPRVEACGAVDELNAALGFVRATAPRRSAALLPVQKQLVTLMGELATDKADVARFEQSGFGHIGAEHTAVFDAAIAALESRALRYDGWATPGENAESAALELARTTCRRAERRVCALAEAGDLLNAEILVYLNRLSDWLWLLAREAEQQG